MKPLNAITLIKESKALFLFVLLSIITHTSIFLINPTFSFTISDEWEGSKGRFLVVELRKKEGEVSKIGKGMEVKRSSEIQRLRGSEVKRFSGRVAEKGSKKAASTPEKDKDNFQVSKKEYPARRKSIGKPVVSPSTLIEASDKAQAMVKEERVEGLSANDIEGRKEYLGQPSESSAPDLASLERALISEDKTGISEDMEAVSAQPSEEPEGHSEAGPIEQEVAQEPEAIVLVEKAVDQPAITSQPRPHLNPLPQGEDAILPHPLQGEGQGRDGVFSGQNEIEVKEPERKEEGKSEVMASEESQPHPHPAPLPEVEGNSDVQTNIKIEATEKEKEPAKVVEQNVEPPAKKKKRTIPFHKMLEPEKEATIGIPIGRPVVKITAPSKKKVNSRVQGISGRAQGNGVARVTLSINGENAVIPVQSGRFLWDTVLKDGKNILSATVWDMEGYSATDSVTVEVLSPKNSFELSIDEPAGGEVESPVAMIRGRVEDATVDIVKLIVNGEFAETPVEDGYFEKTVFLKERENTLEAEAINPAGLTARSGVLKVVLKNPIVPDTLLHLLCDGHDMESHPKVTLRERSQLDDEKGAVSDVDVIEMMSVNEGYGEKVFAVKEGRDGAYTLKVSGGGGTDCKLVVTLNSSKRKVRVFEKRLLEGEEWAVGRFLFPEGVFWDEDEWFSGRVEDKDSITKYKFPEGVTWKELKGE